MPTPHPSAPAIGSGTHARWSEPSPPLSGELRRLSRSPDSSFSHLASLSGLSHTRRTNSIVAEYSKSVEHMSTSPVLHNVDASVCYTQRRPDTQENTGG